MSAHATTVSETVQSAQSVSLRQLEAKARLLETLESLQHLVHAEPSLTQWQIALSNSRKAYENFTTAGLRSVEFPTIINLLEQATGTLTVDIRSYPSECQEPVPPDRCIEAFISDLIEHNPKYYHRPFYELVIDAKHAMRQRNEGLDAYRNQMMYDFSTRLDALIGLALDELMGTTHHF